MFDITTQAVAETAALHVKSAAGEPLYDSEKNPVRIYLYGPGSQPYGMVESRQTARALRRMADNDGKVAAPTRDEQVTETAEDLATLTADFENLGYPPAGDKRGTELFKAVYADPKLGFIVKQVSTFVKDWGRFNPGSSVS